MIVERNSIVLGGGCFWCMEASFDMVRGVVSVTLGYAGGVGTANYELVGSGKTDHAEVVRLQFDPDLINLNAILAIFFTIHNPTTKNRQGNDVGPQYRSLILCSNEGQKEDVRKFVEGLEKDNIFEKSIVTEVKLLDQFTKAEDNHSKYYKNNSQNAYCQLVINPKLDKLRVKFRDFLKDEYK